MDMQRFKSYLQLIGDSNTALEKKLKAAGELSEHLETITNLPQYPTILPDIVRTFITYLSDGPISFISEDNQHQLRKLMLDMLHRLPANESLKAYMSEIVSLMFSLLEKENEENVLVCLKLIIEIYKQYRPQMNRDVHKFILFVRTVYSNVGQNLNRIFDPRPPTHVPHLSDLEVEALLPEIFSVCTVATDQKNAEGQNTSFSVLPRGVSSLKVLSELPIIIVLLYQLYKQNLQQEVADFVPVVMSNIVLQPTTQQRAHPNFNKEVFVDFITAQVKTMSFLAYIIRIYQEQIAAHSATLVKGMTNLLGICPHEVAALRKELLIASRHILATELRSKFVPIIEQLFDQQRLVGEGWTSYETLRPLALSTLADLVHHVRSQLTFSNIRMAVALFSKFVHEDRLPLTIQTMSCKLLLNLVENVKRLSEAADSGAPNGAEGGQGRELLMRVLEVFILKFQAVSKYQLPALILKCKAGDSTAGGGHQESTNQRTAGTKSQSRAPPPPSVQPGASSTQRPMKSPGAETPDDKSVAKQHIVNEMRGLVKTLVSGAKTITWGATACSLGTGLETNLVQPKQLTTKETAMFVRLVKYGMQALDIYTVNQAPSGHLSIRASALQAVKMKEEKEVLEHFAGVFQMLHPLTFKEIFSTCIESVVERIYSNYALQIIANSFLANQATSATFATILVEYLLTHLQDMGTSLGEKSGLHLKLFKLIFGSVTLLAADNEHMLRPHLHVIVKRSMKLALTAKEPYNYFLLLRALFRSIGGGSHDLLYQEFLPLLPELLRGLNSLQSAHHRQSMKDIFVELCLTVPVRLSSLLPYLPLLMDPLVSALNGTQQLVNQGLRTLELCVDNLQPDFLYDHIQPVRAELMQALWKCLWSPTDNISHVALRVLGKFGGGNRKMLQEPQGLKYNDSDKPPPTIGVHFQDCKTPIQLPVQKAVEVAVSCLQTNSTERFYCRQAWLLIKLFLISTLDLDDDKQHLLHLFNNPVFTEGEIPQSTTGTWEESTDEGSKAVKTALEGVFAAAAIKELQSEALPFMNLLVRHYVLVIIAQQAGPFPLPASHELTSHLDPSVLVSAIAEVMGHVEKELSKPCQLSLAMVVETAVTVLGTKERACQLPLFECIAQRMVALCYRRAWYAKLGGCQALRFLTARLSLSWVFKHQLTFLKALLFVMMDLTGEISTGAVTVAQGVLKSMLTLCSADLPEGSTDDLVQLQKKSLYDVSYELVRRITSPNTLVREQAMSGLKLIADSRHVTITEIMTPHKALLQDMVPPKKHLLRHQPVNQQIGLMEGNTFCTTLVPRLLTIDFNNLEHKVYMMEVIGLCDADDSLLLKHQCYKAAGDLVPFKKACARAVAACHYVKEWRDQVFKILFKTLSSTNTELQKAGHECMAQFIGGFSLDLDQVHQAVRPLLMTLADFRKLDLNLVHRLTSLTQLFPNIFNEKLCEQLLQHLRKWLEVSYGAQKPRPSGQVVSMEIQICAAIVSIFHLIQSATPKMIDPLVQVTLCGERSLFLEAASPFRKPLAQFLVRFPSHTLDYFICEHRLKDQHCMRMFLHLLKCEEGDKLRDLFYIRPDHLISMVAGRTPSTFQHAANHNLASITQLAPGVTTAAVRTTPSGAVTVAAAVATQPGSAMPSVTVTTSTGAVSAVALADGMTKVVAVTLDECRFVGIRAVWELVKRNPEWLKENVSVVMALKRVWLSQEFKDRHKKTELLDYSYWKEPRLIISAQLAYFKLCTGEYELLFHMLSCFSDTVLNQFQFFAEYLEETVAKTYSVEWKRGVFFKFVDIFHESEFNQETKARILRYVIIPSFTVAFHESQTEALVGGPPAPDQDSPENVIGVFINRVIDPDNPYGTSDAVRIYLLQFSALLVEQASPYIHDAANKRQGSKLRRLMTFAWPCLLVKSCVDPATKYHGHLLLAHIIARFAIHKRIVLQVFHSLLKAHANEARATVQKALNILTPAMPGRMEDGNTMLIHWTKKIIVEEGHAMVQLSHVLNLIVRHQKVYYPVRHSLVPHMITSIQRLYAPPGTNMDQKRLAIEIAEVIVKWEIQRAKNQGMVPAEGPALATSAVAQGEAGSAEGLPPPSKRRLTQANRVGAPAVQPAVTPAAQPPATTPTTAGTGNTMVGGVASDPDQPIDKSYCDGVVNLLLRMACQLHESGGGSGAGGTTGGGASSGMGESLARRCVALLKAALNQGWPHPDFKLVWMEKLFLSVEQPVGSTCANVCVALEILTFFLSILKRDNKREQILAIFKPLQKGIATCMTCLNGKVIRSVHALLLALMSLFPTESAASGVASKYEELDVLYACVSKGVYEGLSSYERSSGPSQPSLFGTLMILKAACMNNVCYIDRLITSFMRVLQRMSKEHLNPSTPENALCTVELLILSLDLVKNRVGVMSMEMRKNFIGAVLCGLIERTTEPKVMSAIIKLVEDWIKVKSPIAMNQTPTLREKAIMLTKLMMNVEKRFPNDEGLNNQFLELINYIYRDDTFMGSELTSKLEVAFLSGLKSSNHVTRIKYMEVFDGSVRKRLFDRLYYICSSQNWQLMGNHFWIKQCIELLLLVAVSGTKIQCQPKSHVLPAVTSVVNSADSVEKRMFYAASQIQEEEQMDVESIDPSKEEEDLDIEMTGVSDDLPSKDAIASKRGSVTELSKLTLHSLLMKQARFLESCRETKTATFLNALCQLCHYKTDLASAVWVDLFPNVWKVLSERQHQQLAGELIPFIASGCHSNQVDMHPSSAHTFFEALSQCSPALPVRPCVIKFLGENHNLWHRSALMLESFSHDMVSRPTLPYTRVRSTNPEYEMDCSTAAIVQESEQMLGDLYGLLGERDLLAGLWQRRAQYSGTVKALAYEQQGLYSHAIEAYEEVMGKARADLNHTAASSSLTGEFNLWEDHWVGCCKELNQWDGLLEYANSKGNTNSQLVLESAWRVPNWGLMKDSLAQVEGNCPREMDWKVQLYRGYISICHPEDQHLNLIEKLMENATGLLLKEWRRLPSIISYIHIPYLQASQQVVELQEASQVTVGLLPQNQGRSSNNLHDMKATVKTWRNRLPVIADDLTHWSDIFTWRQHHYQYIQDHYDGQGQQNHAMVGVHATAQSIINYGKIARKHKLTSVSLDSLSKIHTIPSVPIVDCFQKIRQQVKCYLLLSGGGGASSVTESGGEGPGKLEEGLEVIESTNLKYFTKEMTAEFYALKGLFLSMLGRSDEANKNFSAAVQLHDLLIKAWALWGDYLEELFTKDRSIAKGVGAITCFLHACRHNNEGKARKYLAKVIWMLSYDNERQELAEAVDKYCVGVPAAQWLPWIPQLLTCLVRQEGRLILNLLSQVGRSFPQAVYFPIRTLYLTVKIEQRERCQGRDPTTPSQSTPTGLTPGIPLPNNPSLVLVGATAGGMLAPLTSPLALPTPSPLPTGGATAPTAVTAGGGDGGMVPTVMDTTQGGSQPVVSIPSGTVSAETIASVIAAASGTATVSTSAGQSEVAKATAGVTRLNTSQSGAGTGSSGSQSEAIRATTPMWRCSRIMNVQRDTHPTTLSALEGIVDQMVWFRESWCEEVLRQLRQGLAKCYAVAFENRGAVSEASITPHTLNFIRKLVSTFGVGLENVTCLSQTFSSAASESLARRAHATSQDPTFVKMKSQFSSDFDFSTVPGSTKLQSVIIKLKKWIKLLEAKTKVMPRFFLIEERCQFLSNFSVDTADVDIPGEYLLPKPGNHYVKILRFMPKVETVNKHSTSARRLSIRGHNGKIYPYLVVNDVSLTEARREERVLQTLRMVNGLLGKEKETVRRLLQFTLPRVVPIAPQMRLVEDNPASLSLLDIYKQRCSKRGADPDAPVALYYERLVAIQQQRGLSGSSTAAREGLHRALREVLAEVQGSIVPRTLLKEWATHTFTTATEYWTFRSTFTLQLAMQGFAEYAFRLTRLNPEMTYIHKDSGYLGVAYYRFDIHDTSGELESNRAVPFRLTPNLVELVGSIGLTGPLTASMVAAARCLVQPSFQITSLLKALLRDEFIMWHRKKQDEAGIKEGPAVELDGNQLISLVNASVTAIHKRLKELAIYENAESNVSPLVAAAANPDNLCRMDPAWHPWL